MRRSLPMCVLLVLFFLTAPSVLAQQDVEGSKYHPLLSRYQGSYISGYDQKEFDEIELPLSRAKDWDTLGKMQRLEGKVTKIFYVFPEGRSALEVFRNYEGGLSRAGFTTLFSCSGIEGANGCGPIQGPYHQWFGAGSNYTEDKQRTLTAKLARPEGDAWVSLHICAPWVFLAVVETKPMETGLVTVNAEALAGDITRTGHAAVYGIYFDTGKTEVKTESEAALNEIAKLLKSNLKLKLHVVGHTDSVGELATNMDLSRRRAEAVVQVLTTKHKIAATRLRGDGVGPLSPVASNKTEEGRAKNRRVELVEQ